MHHGGTEARRKLIHEGLTEQIIGAAIEVHKVLGPGLLEPAYEECVCHELSLRNLKFERQLSIPVLYKRRKFRLWIPAGFISGEYRRIRVEVHRTCPPNPRSPIAYLLAPFIETCWIHHQLQCSSSKTRHCPKSFMIHISPCLCASVVN